MTFDSMLKELMEHDLFPECFKFALDREHQYTVLICDFMQYLKSKPKTVLTLDELMQHYKALLHELMFRTHNFIQTVIICVDLKAVDVKKMLTHTRRYNNKDLLKYDAQNPKLPSKGTDLVPQDWITFAGNHELMRRELYPRLFNLIMFELHPKVGQSVIVSGLPGRAGFLRAAPERPWECNTNQTGDTWQVQPWDVEAELPITPEAEREDVDLYNRVYILEHVAPCPELPGGALVRREWEEAKSDISEGDLRILWFEHWFQQQNVLLCINDGDIFSIGLLYARDRFIQMSPEGRYHFRNRHVIMLKYIETDKKRKAREAKGLYIKPGPFQFIDLNLLYEKVDTMKQLQPMQTRIGTFVFLLILGGTDFFVDFLKGMSAHKVIWKVFFENAPVFSHLVQCPEGVPMSTRDQRIVVLDEDAFRRFIIFCHLEKYEDNIVGRREDHSVTFEELRQRTLTTAKGRKRLKKDGSEDTGYHMPSRNKVRTWCRMIEWNWLYWAEGCRGRVPNPFEKYYDIPYYPFEKQTTDAKPVFIDMVSPRQKPVDAVFAQHFLRNKKPGEWALNPDFEDEEEDSSYKSDEDEEEEEERVQSMSESE